ncbi:MAG: efflux RND transporter periplasmic adaptor subunit, partial [Betaproteobacteria bacterium]|nr:efflux RND transporter periplasmic adaptor subunit [Betaproteobacteria bacterium]
PILVDVVGRTEGSKEVEVRSRVSGIVQKQLYSEGETVRANAPLFQIERAPFDNALAQAKAAAAQDNARLEQTQRESGRLQQLLAKKAISQREADDAASNLKQADAAILSSAARVRDAELNLSYTSVTAPISGITGRSQRSEGSLVTAGSESSLLTTLTQTDPIWVRFSLSESEYALVRGNAAKRAQVKIITADDKEYAFKGKLNFSGSTVDSKIGTVQLRAEFANPDLTLLPGQFVRTQVVAGMQEAIVVPQHAVFQNDQGRFVWVIGPESKATQRKVEAGSWVGRDWIIKSGLNNDDQVIVDNLVKMRPGTLVKVEVPTAPSAGATSPAAATEAAKPAAPAAKN